MGAFEYTALDQKGRNKKGVQEGDTARQVRQYLRDKGWSPLSVDAVAEKPDPTSGKTLSSFNTGRYKLNAGELALITRQMATLIRAGLPLEETLRAVSQQADTPRHKSMLLAVRSKVMEGHTLADGLADFPRAFPDLYRMTVSAGEQSGHLDAVLERLADYTESRQQMHQKVSLALVYPIILTLLAITVVIGLMTFVVPEVVSVFVNIGQELPPLTVGLISTSEFLVNYWFLIAIVIALLSLGASYALRVESIRFKYHRFLLKIPLASKLIRGLNTARFSRTLSILSASGVPILNGLQVSAQVLSSLPMRQAVEDAASRVREGANLSKSLEKSGYFTPMTIHLIASGEASGQLEDMLDRAATNQEREIETMIATMLGIFEPMLILTMGGIVLVIVMAILLPIFDLNQLVK